MLINFLFLNRVFFFFFFFKFINFNNIKYELSNLNLKAPYIPIIPESNFDFDEQCKPKFDIGKNKFIDYLDYLKENNNTLFAHLDDKLTKEQKESYMKWYNKF